MLLNVWYGSGENAWLSNLASREIYDIENRRYVSVEHAYQTWKSGDFDPLTYRKKWVAGSKFRGKRAKTANNWNVRLMEKIILASVESDVAFREGLKSLPANTKFTHRQDRGVWKYAFPTILEKALAKVNREV